MSNFNGDFSNTFYCAVIDFISGCKLKPRNKLKLLTALLDSIDYWLIFSLLTEVDRSENQADKEPALGRIFSYLEAGETFETKIDDVEVRITYETVFLLLIRGQKADIDLIAAKLPKSFKASPLNKTLLLKKLYSFEKKFLRGEPSLFRYAMSAWDTKSDYYKECSTALRHYIQVIREKPLVSILLDKKPSRGFASNSNVMESLTKGFKRKEDNNNIRSSKLIKFLKELDVENIEIPRKDRISQKTSQMPNEKRPPRLEGMDNIILVGPPGTGKTYVANREADGCKKTFVQFHPSYAYENFVQGERLIVLGRERFSQVIDGPLMIAFRRATNTAIKSKALIELVSENSLTIALPASLLSKYEIKSDDPVIITVDEKIDWVGCKRISENKLSVPPGAIANVSQGEIIEVFVKSPNWAEMRPEAVIIDEINRAEVAKVFGELLKAISEKDDFDSEPEVNLQYSGEKFYWPGNLRIIATMNSADRSIGEMDLALKRRFKIKEINPNAKLFVDGKFPYLTDLKEKIIGMNEVTNLNGLLQNAIERMDGSLDSLIEFHNAIGNHHGFAADAFQYLPSFSTSLGVLNKILENEESIFNAKKKLIGHSYFITFARKLSTVISNFNSAGLLQSIEAAQEYSMVIKAEYQSLMDQEIRPQIEAICLENEKLAQKIIKNWLDTFKTSDSGNKINVDTRSEAS